MIRHKHDSLAYEQFASFNSVDGLTHAVFTRHGGVSDGHLASLNVGSTVGDHPENVQENRRRMLSALDVDPASVRSSWQVHGSEVLVLTDRAPGPEEPIKADAIITNQPDLTLEMRFADCVPILLVDPEKRAIGLAHAGWRGTVQGVARRTVEAMQRAFGSDPAALLAGIGPSIGPDSYEVGPEVIEQVHAYFAPHHPDPQSAFVRPPQDASSNPHLDLWEANRFDLQQSGVRQIEVAGTCTMIHQEDYFSHRGAGGKAGRFGVLISLL
ncbi:MAG: peptidoglycan editing factor PgeF [Chloroflexi bacterium]|nr:peptidoglycan editing factor PgeF [Chloroflexota bacterium]